MSTVPSLLSPNSLPLWFEDNHIYKVWVKEVTHKTTTENKQ